MSGSGTAAVLYAATISNASITGAVPEESKERRHHLKDGKGFTNPWDSWKEMSGPSIMRAMAGLDFRRYTKLELTRLGAECLARQMFLIPLHPL